MKVIPYGRQHISDEDIQSVIDVLKSDFLTQGPAVDQFENSFAQFVGCKYAVAVINGTAALHLAALALNVKPGDKVLCATNSFVASANCILYCGGEVEFVDIDPITYCLDIDLLEKKLRASPHHTYKGIVGVDFAGLPIDSERLRALANEFNLWIIEDACHAIGASFTNSSKEEIRVGGGKYSDMTVFSFHPVKHITTGEGGMVTTNNPQLFEKLKLLRSHGIVRDPNKMTRSPEGWYYEMQTLGYNYRLPDVLCALGNSQLKRIDENIARRRSIAKNYDAQLGSLVTTPKITDGLGHAYHLYVIQTEKRQALYEFLKVHNIYTQVHYIPIHKQPFYQERYGKVSLPHAEKYYSKALSLPMYHSMTSEQQEEVISRIKAFFSL